MRKNNFNRIARAYDLLSFMVFGRSLKNAQTAHMEEIPAHASVLLAGDGTGWCLYHLLKNKKCRRIVFIDRSSAMIALARQRIKHLSFKTEVVFLCEDIMSYTSQEKSDVIITPFFLDLFSEDTLNKVIRKLKTNLKKEGKWIVTDFRINVKSRHRYWQTLLYYIMLAFFRVVSRIEAEELLPFEEYMKNAGMIRLKSRCFYVGMIETGVYRHSG